MENVKPIVIFILITAVCAGLVGLFYEVTREPVRIQQEIRQTEMIAAVLPGVENTEIAEVEGVDFVTQLVRGYDVQNQLIGYAITSFAPGYSGPVIIMTGFQEDGTIIAVRVLTQTETPGLGTAIAGLPFLAQFEGRTQTMSVSRMPSLSDEIQALTSATISTAAIVNAINSAIGFMATIQ
ncbi:MAG: RnfABCDGE type electron transport complex subunit G [Defluviitaleaceae bacterium]|nr:RnfABCDGE type electron transport complex subunit G [Defluviitaleaceae bacterium]